MKGLNEISEAACSVIFDVIRTGADVKRKLDNARDVLRAGASVVDPTTFPATGAALVPIGELFELILSLKTKTLTYSFLLRPAPPVDC